MDVVGIEDAFGFLTVKAVSLTTAERRLQRQVAEVLGDFSDDALEAVQAGTQPDYKPLQDALAALFIPFLTGIAVQETMRVSVDVGIAFDPAVINTHAIQWARDYSYELIKGLTDTTRKVVSEAITSFFETPGMTQGDIEKLLEPAFGQVRSQMIATTEVTRASAEGTNEVQRLVAETGLPMTRIWSTANDDLTCPICFPLNDQPESVWAGEFPSGPPAHVNCILPGNIVAVPGLSAGAKSFYVGRAIEITTAGGRSLTVTENHPILTRRGWTKAAMINELDQVVVCTDPKGIASSVYPDYDHVPAKVEEVFASLEMSDFVLAGRVPATPVDLHGDGGKVHGDIDVVYPNSLLLGNRDTSVTQLSGQHRLDWGDMGTGALTAQGPVELSLIGQRNTTSCSVCGSDLVRPSFRRHSRPLYQLSSRATTSGDVILSQDAVDDATADAALVGQFLDRFASDITMDQVVDVREFDSSNHVYDLQSEIYGLYTCNGVLVKNCRCAIGLSAVEVANA